MATRPHVEVADIFRTHGPAYRQHHKLPVHRLQIMRAIENCRTSALGGHVERCGQCDFTRIAYNSCRNRHCPKCQSAERAKWFEARQAELLPTPYFHAVFTLPPKIADLALRNPSVFYNLLFRTSAQTLLTIAADPQHLGAEIGFFSVLHTWGQNLLYHPHVHCVVTGGGLSADHERWVPGKRPDFFVPVRVLSRLFRRLFLDAVEEAFLANQLQFPGILEPLSDPSAFARYLRPLRKAEWVVYCKPPFGGPQQALAYLSRYTHRVAISNDRILSLSPGDGPSGGQVTFQWKDYRKQGQSCVMTIDADEFIRRFLLHSLESGFQRIRHYGFLANCHRRDKLELCRQLLLRQPVSELLPLDQAQEVSACLPAVDTTVPADTAHRCPACRLGVLTIVEWLCRVPRLLPAPGTELSSTLDSS